MMIKWDKNLECFSIHGLSPDDLASIGSALDYASLFCDKFEHLRNQFDFILDEVKTKS